MAHRVERVPGKTPPIASSKQALALTVSTAVALSAPEAASWVLLQALSANVRWWDDGSTPTISSGMVITPGTLLEYAGDLKAFRAIAETAGAILNAAYYTNNPS